MRSVPYSLAVAAIGLSTLSAQPAFAQAAKAKKSGAAQILEFRPTQPGVEYDTPTDPAAIEACKVESSSDPKKKSYTYALRDGQGKLLRRFMDTNGDGKLDQWSYYQDGFEVYRENDLDGDKTLDECRWLNSGGTRIATVEGGVIKSWKQISAEEASKVLVQGLVSGKLPLLDTVLATPEELTAAGLAPEDAAKVVPPGAERVAQIQALRDSLKGWTKDTVWSRFDCTYPHVIPAEPGIGLNKEITLYENAVVFAGPPASQAQQNPGKVTFLQVPEVIRLGEVWKFVSLPRAIDPDKPVVAAESGIRAALFHRNAPAGGPARDEAMEGPLRALADYDAKNASKIQTGEKRDQAKFHLDRIKYVREIVAAAKDPEDKLIYDKQTVDSLIAAYRTGLYPAGKKAIEEIVSNGGKLGSYAAYNLIGAEFALKNEDGGDFRANQKKWMADIEQFLTDYEKSDEAPDARLQLANANEFDAEEAKAKVDYQKLVDTFPETTAGKKAAGALRRLDLTGKSIAIQGAGLKGGAVDSAQFRGKPMLVVFWASWAAPSKRELPELVKLYEKHHKAGLEIIGVSLDNDKDEALATVKEEQITWPQVFEGGGMESKLAAEYGIISLPTIFLVDGQGKVTNRNIRTAADVERQIEKLLANGAGVAQRDQ